ncbi:hypothetical protein ACOSP7_009994 [Xanthoceras sorbifolium]
MGGIGQEKRRRGGNCSDGVWGSGGCSVTAVQVALEPKEEKDSNDSGGEWRKRGYGGRSKKGRRSDATAAVMAREGPASVR